MSLTAPDIKGVVKDFMVDAQCDSRVSGCVRPCHSDAFYHEDGLRASI